MDRTLLHNASAAASPPSSNDDYTPASTARRTSRNQKHESNVTETFLESVKKDPYMMGDHQYLPASNTSRRRQQKPSNYKKRRRHTSLVIPLTNKSFLEKMRKERELVNKQKAAREQSAAVGRSDGEGATAVYHSRGAADFPYCDAASGKPGLTSKPVSSVNVTRYPLDDSRSVSQRTSADDGLKQIHPRMMTPQEVKRPEATPIPNASNTFGMHDPTLRQMGPRPRSVVEEIYAIRNRIERERRMAERQTIAGQQNQQALNNNSGAVPPSDQYLPGQPSQQNFQQEDRTHVRSVHEPFWSTNNSEYHHGRSGCPGVYAVADDQGRRTKVDVQRPLQSLSFGTCGPACITAYVDLNQLLKLSQHVALGHALQCEQQRSNRIPRTSTGSQTENVPPETPSAFTGVLLKDGCLVDLQSLLYASNLGQNSCLASAIVGSHNVEVAEAQKCACVKRCTSQGVQVELSSEDEDEESELDSSKEVTEAPAAFPSIFSEMWSDPVSQEFWTEVENILGQLSDAYTSLASPAEEAYRFSECFSSPYQPQHSSSPPSLSKAYLEPHATLLLAGPDDRGKITFLRNFLAGNRFMDPILRGKAVWNFEARGTYLGPRVIVVGHCTADGVAEGLEGAPLAPGTSRLLKEVCSPLGRIPSIRTARFVCSKMEILKHLTIICMLCEEADTDVSNEPQVCSGSHKTEAKQSSSFALQRMLTTVVDKVLVFHEAAQTHLPTKDGVLAATGASKASCESGGENPQADTDMLITNSLFSSMTSDQWKCSVVLREPSAEANSYASPSYSPIHKRNPNQDLQLFLVTDDFSSFLNRGAHEATLVNGDPNTDQPHLIDHSSSRLLHKVEGRLHSDDLITFMAFLAIESILLRIGRLTPRIELIRASGLILAMLAELYPHNEDVDFKHLAGGNSPDEKRYHGLVQDQTTCQQTTIRIHAGLSNTQMKGRLKALSNILLDLKERHGVCLELLPGFNYLADHVIYQDLSTFASVDKSGLEGTNIFAKAVLPESVVHLSTTIRKYFNAIESSEGQLAAPIKIARFPSRASSLLREILNEKPHSEAKKLLATDELSACRILPLFYQKSPLCKAGGSFEAIFRSAIELGDKRTIGSLSPQPTLTVEQAAEALATSFHFQDTDFTKTMCALADTEKTGELDLARFQLAAHLVYRHAWGLSPYTQLPAYLISEPSIT